MKSSLFIAGPPGTGKTASAHASQKGNQGSNKSGNGIAGGNRNSDGAEGTIASLDGNRIANESRNQNALDNANANGLAQTSAQIEASCLTAVTRNKAEIDDFYSLYAGSSDFTDSSFTADASSLYWSGIDNSWNKDVEWKRAQDVFSDKTLFGGDEGATIHDIYQGSIGNCWFMAAASALAEFPGKIESMFLNPNEVSANGIYALNHYALGHPHTLVVDDSLPLKAGTNKTLFGKVGKDGSLWGAIIEKAFAKFYGNYKHTVGGDPVNAVRNLTNNPAEDLYHDSTAEADLWAKITNHDDEDIIFGLTHNGSDSNYTPVGIAYGHAYLVTGGFELNDGTKLVRVRNPWGGFYGTEKYTGPYSDNAPEWTDAKKS